MYALKTQAHFDSAHFLHGYDGKCKNIHGHRWTVEAEITGETLQKDGFQRDNDRNKWSLFRFCPPRKHLPAFPGPQRPLRHPYWERPLYRCSGSALRRIQTERDRHSHIVVRDRRRHRRRGSPASEFSPPSVPWRYN